MSLIGFGLLDAELRRFFARRVVRGALLAGLLIVLIVNVFQLVRSTDKSVLNSARGTGLPAECLKRNDGGLPVYDGSCLDRNINNGFVVFLEERSDNGRSGYSSGFGDPSQIQGEQVLIERTQDTRIHIASTFADTIRGIGAGLIFLSIGLSSSFIAADFGTSIGTQLMFEPRRRIVYLTKTLAVMLGCATFVFIIIFAAGLLQLLGSLSRGITTGLDAAWFGNRAVDLGRVMLASAFAAPLGLAVAAITKRTVSAVGVFFGMFIALNFLGNTTWGKPIAKILPINGLVAFAMDSFENNNSDFFGLHTLAGAAVLCVVWAAIAIVLATTWFESREIR